ncbi:MAG: toxin-antitoxin system YwqK family antitoxin [Chlamydiia bacterium]
MLGKVAKTLLISLGTLALLGCSPRALLQRNDALTTVVLQDRNGFSETVSQPDRLARLATVDFNSPQPYERVIRVFQRNEDGSVPSILTCYYPNGQLSELLDVLSGRASGRYCRWHQNGQINLYAVVMGGVADVNDRAKQTWLFDGESLVWDEEGHLIARIPYDRGALHGIEQHYYPSGSTQESIPYVKGLLHGTREAYSPNGELLQRQDFDQGQPHGHAESWWLHEHRLSTQEIWSQGLLLQGEYYHADGTSAGSVQQGSGHRILFDTARMIRRYQVQTGRVEGFVEEFNASNVCIRTWNEAQGMKQGVERVFEPKNGNLKLELCWKDDVLQGPCRTYYVDGKLESQKELSDNQVHGRCLAWYPSGQVMLLEEYQQGILERGEYYELGSLVPVSQVVQGHGTVTLYDGSGRKAKTIPIVNGIPTP